MTNLNHNCVCINLLFTGSTGSLCNCIVLTSAQMSWNNPDSKLTSHGTRKPGLDHQQNRHFLFEFTSISVSTVGAQNEYCKVLSYGSLSLSFTYFEKMTSTPLYTSRAYNLWRGSKFIVIFILNIQFENLMKESPNDITAIISFIYLSCSKTPLPILFPNTCVLHSGWETRFCNQLWLDDAIILHLFNFKIRNKRDFAKSLELYA
jgi:hypothetical protein